RPQPQPARGLGGGDATAPRTRGRRECPGRSGGRAMAADEQPSPHAARSRAGSFLSDPGGLVHAETDTELQVRLRVALGLASRAAVGGNLGTDCPFRHLSDMEDVLLRVRVARAALAVPCLLTRPAVLRSDAGGDAHGVRNTPACAGKTAAGGGVLAAHANLVCGRPLVA